MLHVLWPFALGVFGWFVANFFGAPLLDILLLRREIHQELIFFWDVRLISADRALREHQFDDAGRRIGKLGSRLIALKASIYEPLQSIVSKLGYDLDGAGRDLLNLSTELDDEERLLIRCRVEIALRLPQSQGSYDRSLEMTERRSRVDHHYNEV
jgi:hypothetical protein